MSIQIYITQQRNQGVGDAAIREALRAAGWQEREIDAAFAEVVTERVPMVLSARALLVKARQLVKRHRSLFLSLTSIAALAQILLACALLIIDLYGLPQDPIMVIALLSGLVLLMAAVVLTTGCAVIGVYVVAHGEHVVRLREVYRLALARWWRYIGAVVVSAMVVFGAGLIFVLPAIVMGVLLFCADVVAVTEGRGPMSAVIRSWSLLRATFLKVAWRVIVITFFAGTVIAAARLVAYPLVLLPAAWDVFAFRLVTIAVTVLYVLPVVAAYNFLLYGNLKYYSKQPRTTVLMRVIAWMLFVLAVLVLGWLTVSFATIFATGQDVVVNGVTVIRDGVYQGWDR